MNTEIQKLAESLGITRPKNGTWIQAINELQSLGGGSSNPMEVGGEILTIPFLDLNIFFSDMQLNDPSLFMQNKLQTTDIQFYGEHSEISNVFPEGVAEFISLNGISKPTEDDLNGNYAGIMQYRKMTNGVDEEISFSFNFGIMSIDYSFNSYPSEILHAVKVYDSNDFSTVYILVRVDLDENGNVINFTRQAQASNPLEKNENIGPVTPGPITPTEPNATGNTNYNLVLNITPQSPTQSAEVTYFYANNLKIGETVWIDPYPAPIMGGEYYVYDPYAFNDYLKITINEYSRITDIRIVGNGTEVELVSIDYSSPNAGGKDFFAYPSFTTGSVLYNDPELTFTTMEGTYYAIEVFEDGNTGVQPFNVDSNGTITLT